MYSVDVFTPVIDLRQANYWLPKYDKEHWIFGGVLRGYLWFQIISGWIIVTLFLTGLSGLVKI